MNKLYFSFLTLALLALSASRSFAQSDPLATAAQSAQTSAVASITTLAPVIFAVIVAGIGIKVGMKWLRKVAAG